MLYIIYIHVYYIYIYIYSYISGRRIDSLRTPEKMLFHRLISQLTFVFCYLQSLI